MSSAATTPSWLAGRVTLVITPFIAIIGVSAMAVFIAKDLGDVGLAVGLTTILGVLNAQVFNAWRRDRRSAIALRDIQRDLRKVEKLVSRAEWRSGEQHKSSSASLGRLETVIRQIDNAAALDGILSALRDGDGRQLRSDADPLPRVLPQHEWTQHAISSGREGAPLEGDLERLLIRMMRARSMEVPGD